jgi:hypothetical protein
MMENMRTALFNLQEIRLENHDLQLEFYAGDLFDIYSDVLVLSAFRGGFAPVPETTWGRLHEKTGMGFSLYDPGLQTRISENMVAFSLPPNNYFSRLVALEMVSLDKRTSFTFGTLKSRYRELGNFLEQIHDQECESISLPLLGTGNQKITLQDSISELMETIGKLKKSKLKIIRVFANSWQAIGSLNLMINRFFQREEAVKSQLLLAAIEEMKELKAKDLSVLSKDTLQKLVSLSEAAHVSLNTFGIAGRHFAEKVTADLYVYYALGDMPETLHLKIVGLMHSLVNERPYVVSYIRLLQNYGNQAAHTGQSNLNHLDASAIIIAVIRIIDFYESEVVPSLSGY